MDKNLPKVFANPINKELNNNKEVFYSNNSDRSVNNINVIKKINEIFASIHHVYKSRVKIKTPNGTEEATIVGKTNNDLLTLEGNRISISTIEDIEKI